jgi:hypothetical protein
MVLANLDGVYTNAAKLRIWPDAPQVQKHRLQRPVVAHIAQAEQPEKTDPPLSHGRGSYRLGLPGTHARLARMSEYGLKSCGEWNNCVVGDPTDRGRRQHSTIHRPIQFDFDRGVASNAGRSALLSVMFDYASA